MSSGWVPDPAPTKSQQRPLGALLEVGLVERLWVLDDEVPVALELNPSPPERAR